MTPAEVEECAKQALIQDQHLEDSLVELLSNVGNSLPDVCSFGLIVGDE